MTLIIQTERLVLRLLTIEDASFILTLLNQESFILNIGDKNIRTLEEAQAYIECGPLAMQSQLGFSLYCCQSKEDGELIGLSGLIKRDGVLYPEVGFAFLADYCRLGYGRESAEAVVNYAFNKLKLIKLNAICNIDNTASQRLLKSLNFEYLQHLKLPNIDNSVLLFERTAHAKVNS